MRTCVSLGLLALLVMPSLATAQDRGILASAERITEGVELQQNDVGGTRRSTGRVALGVVLAGVGAAMLLIDPKQPVQPTQPGIVPQDALINETAAFLRSNLFTRSVMELGTIFTCYPNFERSCEYTLDAYVNGVFDGGIIGAAGALAIATSGDRTIYADQFKPFIPFKKRSPGLKFGGAALAITGAAIAGFWSQVPVMNQLTVAPTHGGIRGRVVDRILKYGKIGGL